MMTQILVLTGAQAVAVVVVRRVAFRPETRGASYIFQRHVSAERRSSAHSRLSVVKTGPGLELARRPYMMVEQSTQREQTERPIVCLVPKISCFPSRQSNSLHLPLITPSLVPHYLHLVHMPISPVAHSLTQNNGVNWVAMAD
ncbi:hypothetical protein EYF80_035064 [Liparis tanakae]|uniref:Uncharacterized protein n=1 Tax=Liparis tanakae TaxID=230148 RepID=A0A4Z2GN86_9TELE|nr:hypothetical protein EYF80_035064 [Liparis tanakae]